MRRFLRICLLAGLPLFVLGMMTLVVRAHAGYDRSIPAADAVIAEAPERLQVWFTQELFRRQGENRLEVYAPGGERVDLDDAAIDDDNRRLMAVSLPADLPPGRYTVRWRTLSSEDGHEGRGEFVFTVDPDAAELAAVEGEGTEEITEEARTPAEIATPEPEAEVVATPTAPPALPAPAPAQPGVLPCAGSTALIVLALGALVLGRQRSRTF
jgi:methionine-rich copper-binding protein CopC